MYSPRGVLMLAHNIHDVQVFKRHVHANRLAGIDNEWLTADEAKAFCPHPQHRSRRALSDHWARRCSGAAAPPGMMPSPGAMPALPRRSGVDIIQNCEVKGIRRGADGAVTGLETTRGLVKSKRVGVVAAGHSSVVMAMAGVTCRSRVIRCRHWSASRSSRSCPAW